MVGDELTIDYGVTKSRDRTMLYHHARAYEATARALPGYLTKSRQIAGP